MADFRKWFFALVAVAFIAALTIPAQASVPRNATAPTVPHSINFKITNLTPEADTNGTPTGASALIVAEDEEFLSAGTFAIWLRTPPLRSLDATVPSTTQ